MFMRESTQTLNTYIETLKTWKIRRQILGYKAEGYVTNVNPAKYINVLYPSKSMYKFTMVLHF